MSSLLKIDSILYRVSDLRAAERFYVGVLGLKKAWEDADGNEIPVIDLTKFGGKPRYD